MLSGCDNQLHHMPRERAQHLPALNQAAMQVLCPIPWIISCAVHNHHVMTIRMAHAVLAVAAHECISIAWSYPALQLS